MATPELSLTEEEFQNNARRLSALVQEFEELPYPEIREKVFDLLGAIDRLHRVSLVRLIKFLREQGPEGLVERAAADPVTLTLLQLYDLAPLEPQEQVIMVLESLRTYISSRGCMVELLDVAEGVVRLRLNGPSLQDNSDAAQELKQIIETALRESFPGFRSIKVEEPVVVPPPAARTIIPLQRVRESALKLNRPVFTEVMRLEALPPGELKSIEVGEARILLARVDSEVYAYHNACPGSPLPLEMGKLEGKSLICPWHQCLFELPSGKRLDGGKGRLAVVPVAIKDGMIQLALKTEPLALGKNER